MTVWNATDDGHADLSSHDAFINGAPHNTFARLRRDEPVAWCDYAGGQGFWSITRHEDILECNRNNVVFSSARGIPHACSISPAVIGESTLSRRPIAGLI